MSVRPPELGIIENGQILGESLAFPAILPCCSFPTSSVQNGYCKFLRRTSWQSPKPAWEASSLDEFWLALDETIFRLISSVPEIEELTVDFVLAAVEWLSISLPSDEPLTDLKKFPRIPYYLALSLAEGNPAKQARGLDRFVFNFKHWIRDSSLPLERVWDQVGLAAKLMGMFKNPQNWDQDT